MKPTERPPRSRRRTAKRLVTTVGTATAAVALAGGPLAAGATATYRPYRSVPGTGQMVITGALDKTVAVTSCTNDGPNQGVYANSPKLPSFNVSVATHLPSSAQKVNLATTTAFEISLSSAVNTRRGVWASGGLGGENQGSGTLSISRGGRTGTANTTMVFGGNGAARGTIHLTAHWRCS
jgi:hypothetical protein